MRAAYDRRRLIAHAALSAIDGITCPLPDGAFYVFPDVRGVLGRTIGGRPVDDDEELAEALLDGVRVAVVPGTGFGAPGCLRLSYALSDHDLTRGLDRLADGPHRLTGRTGAWTTLSPMQAGARLKEVRR